MTELFPTLLKLAIVAILAVAVMSAQAADPGDQERAASALEQNIKTDPNNAELWLHLGYAYRKQDKIDRAREAFEKAATLNPNEKNAHFMLGLIYESQHRNQEAKDAWAKYRALEQNPEQRDIANKHIHRLSQ